MIFKKLAIIDERQDDEIDGYGEEVAVSKQVG